MAAGASAVVGTLSIIKRAGPSIGVVVTSAETGARRLRISCHTTDQGTT